MKVKIGDYNQRWIVHPRTHGDLILTSESAVAVVNTLEKFAVVGPSLVSLKKVNERVTLRQDVVDRLLDAEREARSSVLPVCHIQTPSTVHSMDLDAVMVLRASDTRDPALA